MDYAIIMGRTASLEMEVLNAEKTAVATSLMVTMEASVRLVPALGTVVADMEIAQVALLEATLTKRTILHHSTQY